MKSGNLKINKRSNSTVNFLKNVKNKKDEDKSNDKSQNYKELMTLNFKSK